MKSLRYLLLLAGSLLVVAGCTPRIATELPRGPAAPPRLVVMIAVDQMPSWAFARRTPLFRHGYRRLLDQGVYIPELELPYALPFTAPGHASLGTGTSAVEHGVFGNMWFRRAERKELSAEWDPASPVLTTNGQPSQDTASGAALRVEGIGDALKRQHHDAHVISIGLKARAACFFAGQHPDVALFYEPSSGGLITSTYYAKTLPPWVEAFNAARPFAQYANAVWQPLDSALLETQTQRPDAAAGEGADAKFGVTFPHALGLSSNAAKAFVATPFGDQLVLAAAEAAVIAEGLGRDATPDLLAISLNSHDFAGHNWGQESWEVLDLALRQDISLGRFFDRLDQVVGVDNYVVVLTSDHGATPLVEAGTVPGARRIPSPELRSVIDQAMVAAIGGGPWVDQIVALNVYLVPAWRDLAPEVQQRALAAATQALLRVPNIAAAGPTADVVKASRAACGAGLTLPTLLCRSLTLDLVGELYVVPERGSLLTDYKTGTHHDAPSQDNRFVPLLMWGSGITSQRLDAAAARTNLAVAPTVARLLGITPPDHATEASLLK